MHYSAGPTTAASAAGALDAAATKAGVAGREDVVLVLDDSQALAPAALGALLPLLDTPGVAAAHGRAALGGRSPAGDVFDLVDHRVLFPLTAGAEAWHASAVLGAPLAVRADFLAAAGGFVCGDGVGGVACGVAGTCASLAAALAARRVGVAVTHAVCVHGASGCAGEWSRSRGACRVLRPYSYLPHHTPKHDRGPAGQPGGRTSGQDGTHVMPSDPSSCLGG